MATSQSRRLLIAGSMLLLAGCGGLSEADAKACDTGRKLVKYALSMTVVAPEEVVGQIAESAGARFPALVADAADEGVKKALGDVRTTLAAFRPTQVTSSGGTVTEQWGEKLKSDQLRKENVEKLDATLRKQGNALNEACGT
ncbi:hypothetical protein [Herbidospora mongoliensis]|uniref:hypothetical protein n=1 Tax=Herbidospora mongoliensis TaxID=688067 RepID=UPI000ACAA86D|nr:hypothetical protein [Herbidospora mongoliensis]